MSGLAPTGPVPGKPWTLFIYADGNNNLDRQIHREYLDLAEKGVSKDVNVILRMAKNGKVNDYMLTSPTQSAPQVMALGGDPPSEDQMAKRWKIESAAGYFKRSGLEDPWDRPTKPGHIPISDYVFTPEPAHEVAAARTEKPLYAVPLPGGVVNTDLNMGDPETLSSFLKLGIRNYPAQHYAVLFHDHGEAYRGLCEDDFHGKDSLSLEELKTALAAASQEARKKMDIVAFNACKMAQADMASQIKETANIAVGSQELVAGGFPFAGYLASGPMEMWAGPRAVAKGFVELTQESRIQTVSALDLSKMSSLEEAVGKLADGILALKDPADIEKIRAILTKCERFAQYFPADYHSGLVDLLDLSRKLAADEELTSRSPGIREAAIEIFRILDEEGGIIAQRNSKDQVFRREWWRKDDGKYFFDMTTKDFVPEEKIKEKPDDYRLWAETGASSVSGSELEKATRFAFKRSSLWSSTQAGGLSVYLPHKKEDLDSKYTQEGNPNPLNLAFIEKTGWDKVVRLLAA